MNVMIRYIKINVIQTKKNINVEYNYVCLEIECIRMLKNLLMIICCILLFYFYEQFCSCCGSYLVT